jgi:hypothetical protein
LATVWTGFGGGGCALIQSTIIGGSWILEGISIFTLITTATTATWAAMIASIALGEDFRTAVTGRLAA